MSTIAAPLSVAGTRSCGDPVRTQNGKFSYKHIPSKKTPVYHMPSALMILILPISLDYISKIHIFMSISHNNQGNNWFKSSKDIIW